MKIRLPRRRVWRVAIYLGALLLVAIAIDLIVADARRHVRPGYLTTRIVQPRKPDGSIDYAIALDEYFSRGVTPANNAAIPLLQVLGRAALAKNRPPRFFVPQFGGQRTLTLLETQLPHAKCLREAGDALHARAMQRLKDGDGNGFIDGALALHRLARLLSQASTMVERIVAMSIET